MQQNSDRGHKLLAWIGVLVSIPLAVYLGYQATVQGFWNVVKIFPVDMYALYAGLCGGFGVDSILILILQPRTTRSSGQHQPRSEISPEQSKSTSTNPLAEGSRGESASDISAEYIPGIQTPRSITSNQEFLATIIELGNMAKESQELVENEEDLVKRERVRLSLRRREFRQLFATVKRAQFETF